MPFNEIKRENDIVTQIAVSTLNNKTESEVD